MRVRRRAGAVSLVAVSFLALVAPAVPASGDYGGPLPSFKNLFNQAVQKVRANPKFKRAVMLEADGSTKNGRAVKHARGIVKVRFVFNNQRTPNSNFASAFIKYGPPPKLFGAVHGVTSPFLEDREIARPPKMGLKNAVRLLRRAGFHNRFRFVTLRKPLTNHKTHPLYIFGLGKRGSQSFVEVDTVTHKVHPIS